MSGPVGRTPSKPRLAGFPGAGTDLGDQNPACGIHGDDAVEAGGAQDNLVVHWDGAAHQTGVASLRNHCDAVLIAVGEHLGDFLSGARLQDQARAPVVLSHPVTV